MCSRRVCAPTSVPPVSASGISPQNDHVSSLGSAAGMFSGWPLALRCLTRSRKFNNPNKEAFTVTFNVIGNLARTSQSSSAGGGSSGRDPTGTLTNLVYSVSYNPLLNTLSHS